MAFMFVMTLFWGVVLLVHPYRPPLWVAMGVMGFYAACWTYIMLK